MSWRRITREGIRRRIKRDLNRPPRICVSWKRSRCRTVSPEDESPMSVRSLNWLKFGGLVGLAFVLGLLFAGLLDLPQSSLAQGGVSHFVSSRPAVKPVAAPNLAASRSLVELSEAFSAVAEHVRPSVVYVKSERKDRITQVRPRVPRGISWVIRSFRSDLT